MATIALTLVIVVILDPEVVAVTNIANVWVPVAGFASLNGLAGIVTAGSAHTRQKGDEHCHL